MLEHCTICPRKCGVNRLNDELGHCRTGKDAIVSSYGPHFGEERELVGEKGSGTIFFSFCNLNCVYCQNYDISQYGHGNIVTAQQLADMMLDLQNQECLNINLVSPTHVVPQILHALAIAKEKGLNIPIVYNSGGYDSVNTLKLLDGVIDIYMPDAKYGTNEAGDEYSHVPKYFEINRLVLRETYRQVGDLIVDNEVALRGLLVRHLVLPNRIACSNEVLNYIAKNISKNTYVNIMNQYRPWYHSEDYIGLSRQVFKQEFQEVIDFAKRMGLTRI